MAKKKSHSGQFKKGGGRVGKGGGGGGTTTVVVAAAARPPVKRATRKVTHHKKTRKHHKRHSGSSAGVTIPKIGAAALLLASAAGTNNGPLGATVYDLVQKVPGAKTFGGAATAGLLLGGLHHFTKFGGGLRPYMRAAGIVGVVAAALKLGEAGMQFKWLGDPSPFDADV